MTEKTSSIISSQTELNALCVELSAGPYFTIDTEFLRDKTYYPQLCLIQVASPDGQPKAIDPLMDGIDLAPLLTAMKVLTTADVYVLCRLCNLHARYKELTDFLMSKGANGGVYMVKDGNGRVRGVAELPQAWEWRQIHGMICSHERELGLTPAARTRLRVEPSSLPATGMMDMPSVAGPSGMKIQDFFSGGGPKPGGPPKSQARA